MWTIHDQRTASTYIFGAICPAEGKAAGLILPWCNTEATNLHLATIAAAVAPSRHAALLVDQAGWHLTPPLQVPDNITIVPLPAKCPELKPAGKRLAAPWLKTTLVQCAWAACRKNGSYLQAQFQRLRH